MTTKPITLNELQEKLNIPPLSGGEIGIYNQVIANSAQNGDTCAVLACLRCNTKTHEAETIMMQVANLYKNAGFSTLFFPATATPQGDTMPPSVRVSGWVK